MICFYSFKLCVCVSVSVQVGDVHSEDAQGSPETLDHQHLGL